MNDKVPLPLYQTLFLLVSYAYLQRTKPSKGCEEEYRESAAILGDGRNMGK